MKTLISTLIISTFFSISLFGQNIGDSPQTKLGFTTVIKSEILGDSLEIFTHLPFNYKKDRENPLILLLDPHAAFKAFSACTELLAYDRNIPTSIVVGFPQYKYVKFDSVNIEADLNLLAKFMDQELLPYLNSKYNITKTIIWGPGATTGLISSYFMLEYPDLFDGYISDIPDFNLISNKAFSKNAFDKIKDENVKYYLFGSRIKDIYNEAFLNNLKSNAPKGLKWHYSISDEPNKIIYRLNNYLHALESFFNDAESQSDEGLVDKSQNDTLVLTTISKDLYICTCKPDIANPGGEGKIYFQGRYINDQIADDASYHDCDERFLMQWDLSELPDGIKIIEAKMRLVCYGYTGDKKGQLVYECISEEWDENAGYSKKPATLHETRVKADWPVKSTYHTIDITSFVKLWYEGSIPNYGLMGYSINTETKNSALFCSANFPQEDARPQLTIIFTKE